jgi:hypothetical protein
MKLIAPLIAALACSAFAPAASAQWHWIDHNGRSVFSDRAPPPDIPDRNVRRQPGERGRTFDTPLPGPAAAAGNTAPPANAPASTPQPGSDPVLLEKKRQADQQAAKAQAAQRQQEEARLAQLRADSCTRARQALAGLNSGMRMTRTNEQGEREFLDDTARAAEAQRIQSVIDSDCR